jgi:hypothetical protein
MVQISWKLQQGVWRIRHRDAFPSSTTVGGVLLGHSKSEDRPGIYADYLETSFVGRSPERSGGVRTRGFGWSFIALKEEFVGTTIESSSLFLDRFRCGFSEAHLWSRQWKAVADDLLTLFLVVVLSAWNAGIAPH